MWIEGKSQQVCHLIYFHFHLNIPTIVRISSGNAFGTFSSSLPILVSKYESESQHKTKTSLIMIKINNFYIFTRSTWYRLSFFFLQFWRGATVSFQNFTFWKKNFTDSISSSLFILLSSLFFFLLVDCTRVSENE